MNKILSFILALLLCACAQAPKTQAPADLFSDQSFNSAQEKPQIEQIFAVNDDMRRFINERIATQIRQKGLQQALFDALYTTGQLQLNYDAVWTRNAAQTFADRSGNCLSLVIMTAAFAKEMGLSVQFQGVKIVDSWSRSGDLYFSMGHVNLVLGKKRFEDRLHFDKSHLMTVDFLPPEYTAGQHTIDLDDKTIIAMYLNNRAAEFMTQNQLQEAYWLAREAIKQDPDFLPAYNTLGVVYLRNKLFPQALIALKHAYERDPSSTIVLSNLVQAHEFLGNTAQTLELKHRLALAQPYPPFYYFKIGQAAFENRDYATAKKMFSKELDRSPDYHEFHYWLALSELRLGEVKQAQSHLVAAKENSTSSQERAIYAAKLDFINARTDVRR